MARELGDRKPDVLGRRDIRSRPERVTTLRVGAGYIEWAHWGAAEEGCGAAERLMEMTKGRKIVRVDISDEDLRTELQQVAELWDHPETEDRNHARTARRIRRAIEDFVLGR